MAQRSACRVSMSLIFILLCGKDNDIYDSSTLIPIIILHLPQLFALFPFPITLNQPIQAYMQYTPAKEVQEKQISYIHTPCQRAIKQDKESGNRDDTNHHHPHPHPRAQQLMMKMILIRQDWSEVIRSSFDHDPLSYNRRTDREYRELRHSHLSVLISGTPGQVKPLIPSSENGLFSRQMFYYMPRVLHWINQFSLQRTDTSLEFQKLGKDWIAHLREIQKLGVISLRLTDAQIVSFNEVFQTLFERSRKGTGNEMNSSVVRMAINIGRILSIVALLRITGECEEAGDFAASLRKSPRLTPDSQTCADNIKDGIITRWDLSIQEDDFQAVLSLAEPMYLHAVHILSFLPANEVKNRGMADQERLFITLDTGFTYQSLLEEAEKLKIPKNTACSCLQRWQKQGIVRKGEKRGDYKKT